MRFQRTKKRDPEKHQVSDCGRYEIWVDEWIDQVQKHVGRRWAARCVPVYLGCDGHQYPWLIDGGTYREAVDACKEAEASRLKSVREQETCARCRAYKGGVDRRRAR